MRRTVLLITLILVPIAAADVTVTVGGKTVDPFKKDAVDQMVDGVVRQYNEMVGNLRRELKQPNLPNMTKVKVAYALGELRAREGISVLIDNINLIAERGDRTVGIGRWLSEYPAREALVKIGRPRSWTLLGVIGSQKFREARVDGYAGVLVGIEGAQGAAMKLKDRMRQAKETAVKQQYQMVIDRVEAIRELQRAGKQTKRTRSDDSEEPGADPGARVLAEGGLPPIVLLLIGVGIGAGAATLIMLARRKAAGATK